jgi:hypothetical protein
LYYFWCKVQSLLCWSDSTQRFWARPL